MPLGMYDFQIPVDTRGFAICDSDVHDTQRLSNFVDTLPIVCTRMRQVVRVVAFFGMPGHDEYYTCVRAHRVYVCLPFCQTSSEDYDSLWIVAHGFRAHFSIIPSR